MTVMEKVRTDHARFQEIESALLDPATSADPARVAALARERGGLARVALPYARCLELTRQIDEARRLAEESAADPELAAYAATELEALREQHHEAREALRDVLYERETGADHAGLILEIRAGTGGDEAALFARDLHEMYRRFAERMGWAYEALEFVPTELGGFKEASFSITGAGAFRHLQFESGGHRVQRVPETEAQGRIHTSLATVAVLAEPEEVELDIRPEDLEVDVMRAGGPGGQHQNKTESAVRLTHRPTGTVVVCRDERSQHRNKAKALRLLRSRIYEQMQERSRAERAETRRTLIGSGDRSQRIRTYNFPQNRVTDHRLGLTLYNLDRVMLGELELVTAPLIEHDRNEQLGDLDPTGPGAP
jgi:peptide chain release factor 1